MSYIITARLDKETMKAVKKYKINVSQVVRYALKSEIKKRERSMLKEKLAEAKAVLGNSKEKVK
jgi:post-segregation antitoxin (ccd killing protein)